MELTAEQLKKILADHVLWLAGANLVRANLVGANLVGANLVGARLEDGETFDTYLTEVLPALLTAGGKSLDDLVAAGAFDCHSWDNCPMALAFGIRSSAYGPPLLRSRISQFVTLFDAKAIPKPTRDAAGAWAFVPAPYTPPAGHVARMAALPKVDYELGGEG